MARITLEPNECFEHFHKEESVTTLKEGDAIFIDDNGSERLLMINEPILTAPMKSHTIKNIGNIACQFDCGHGNGGSGGTRG